MTDLFSQLFVLRFAFFEHLSTSFQEIFFFAGRRIVFVLIIVIVD